MKLLFIALLSVGTAYAVPAYNGNITFKQADGTSFEGKLKGDEYFSWVEDTQGNVIKYNHTSKNYEYAKLEQVKGNLDLVTTGIKVEDLPVFQHSSVLKEKIHDANLSTIWKRKKNETNFHH